MKRKLQVFVSSTFTDLIEERQAAVSAILKAGHIPAGMELFTAADRSQMDIIKNCFKKCVYAFNSDKFVNSEEDCVKECIE